MSALHIPSGIIDQDHIIVSNNICKYSEFPLKTPKDISRYLPTSNFVINGRKTSIYVTREELQRK